MKIETAVIPALNYLLWLVVIACFMLCYEKIGILRRINWEWLSFFLVVGFIVDAYSTYRFAEVLGTSVEANFVLRFMMEAMGIIPALVLHGVVSMIGILLVCTIFREAVGRVVDIHMLVSVIAYIKISFFFWNMSLVW